MNDSTIRWLHVIGQALSIDEMPDSVHFNEVTPKEMKAYFENGQARMGESIGNVQTIYYLTNDKDSSTGRHELYGDRYDENVHVSIMSVAENMVQ